MSTDSTIEIPTCGVCGAKFDADDPPPTWSLGPDGRPKLSKPVRMDPETGAMCWCTKEAA